MPPTLRALSVSVNYVFNQTGRRGNELSLCAGITNAREWTNPMKISIEMARSGELPSQGRNRGSIPLGGTTDSVANESHLQSQTVNADSLVPGTLYRATMDDGVAVSEFVFFVGWTHARDALVFEDGMTDLHKFKADEVEVVAHADS